MAQNVQLNAADLNFILQGMPVPQQGGTKKLKDLDSTSHKAWYS